MDLFISHHSVTEALGARDMSKYLYTAALWLGIRLLSCIEIH